MLGLLLLNLLGEVECYRILFYLSGCEGYVLRLSHCEQSIEQLCELAVIFSSWW